MSREEVSLRTDLVKIFSIMLLLTMLGVSGLFYYRINRMEVALVNYKESNTRLVDDYTILQEMYTNLKSDYNSLYKTHSSLKREYEKIVNSENPGDNESTRVKSLMVDSTKIVDENGTVVKLTGFNAHGPWDGHSDLGEPSVALDENDLIWMKENGFNCIRLNLWWEDFEIWDDVYDETKLSQLDNIIDLCEEHGIYVILDCHQWGYSSKFPMADGIGRGIPHWAGPENYSEDEMDDFIVDLWAQQGGASETLSYLTDWWMFVADRYKDEPAVFAHHLLNEPWSPWIPEHDDNIVRNYQRYFDRVLGPAIREIDPEVIIVYDAIGVNYRYIDEQLAQMEKGTLSNVIRAVHHYAESWEEEGDYDSSKKNRIETIFEKIYQKFIVEFKTPIMITEMGGDMTMDNNLQWLDDSLEAAREKLGYDVNWLIWDYGKNGELVGWRPRQNWPNTEDMPVVEILQRYN